MLLAIVKRLCTLGLGKKEFFFLGNPQTKIICLNVVII